MLHKSFSGDSCCNPLSLGRMEKLLKQNIPNVYIYSVMIGSNVVMVRFHMVIDESLLDFKFSQPTSTFQDTEHGFFGNVNDQVAEVCRTIQNDEKLKNGYNAIGFSQGSQFLYFFNCSFLKISSYNSTFSLTKI